MSKIHVGIICGGKSAEHEVSLISAQNIYKALDKQKYSVSIFYIDQEGKWYIPTSIKLLLDNGKKEKHTNSTPTSLTNITHTNKNEKIDVIFSILHGTFGEDGTIQGLLNLLDVAYVGAGVLGSAVGMDKDVTKRLLKEAGLPVGSFMVLHVYEKYELEEIIKKIGLPLFVKPANLGSSIGVSKVKKKQNC